MQPSRWHNGLNQFTVDNLLPLTDGAVTASTDRKDILIKVSCQIHFLLLTQATSMGADGGDKRGRYRDAEKYRERV